MIYLARYHSGEFGKMILASNGAALTGLWFEGQKQRPRLSDREAWILREDLAIFEKVRAYLDAYFRGENPETAAIPLAPSGTVFQRQVWQMLCKIPFGKTVTYGELAGTLGEGGTSPRAIGNAVGHSPIAVIIPCHRVLGKGGKLCGYAGGLSRKSALLQLEKALLI